MAEVSYTTKQTLPLIPAEYKQTYQADYQEVVRLGMVLNNPLAIEAANVIDDKLGDALRFLYRQPSYEWLDEAAYQRYFQNWKRTVPDTPETRLINSKYPDLVSASTAAELVANIGIHLMRDLAELLKSEPAPSGRWMEFSLRLAALITGAYSIAASQRKEKTLREHLATIPRKLGTSDANARNMILSKAMDLLEKHPKEYRWNTEQKKGQIKLSRLADAIAECYNRQLKPHRKDEWVSSESIRKYLAKLVNDGNLK